MKMRSSRSWQQRGLRLVVLLLWLLSCWLTLPSGAWADEVRLPTRLEQMQAGNDQAEVLLPDWRQIAFDQLPAIATGGAIDRGAWSEQIGYDISRVWQAGQTPDEFLKLGDIAAVLRPELFSLESIGSVLGETLAQASLADFHLAANQTIAHLVEIVPDLGNRLVTTVKPILALFTGQNLVDGVAGALSEEISDFGSLTIAEAIDRYPELGQRFLGDTELFGFQVADLPNLSGVQLQQFDQWQSSFVQEVPGLAAVPLGQFPRPMGVDVAGIVMRIDMIYNVAENHRQTTISGSDVDGFAVPCQIRDCAYIELDDLENEGRSVRGAIEGKQWVSGKYQEVNGGHGLLGEVNGGKEPTGRLPFGSLFKVVVMEPDENQDSVETALFFRACSGSSGCTPYIIGPIPFFTYRVNAKIFVGLLTQLNSEIDTSTPTGAQRNGDPGRYGTYNPSAVDCYDSNGQPTQPPPAAGGAVQGVDIDRMARAIQAIESGGNYNAVGPYGCADGGRNCGRGLGRYQFMNYNEFAAQTIARKSGGQAFLNRVRSGQRPTQAEMMQFFPPADQEQAFRNSLSALAQRASRQIDPTTGRPFTGGRLVERIAQMHHGGAYSRIDSRASDGNITTYQYGVRARQNYESGGGTVSSSGSGSLGAPGSVCTAPGGTNTATTNGDGVAHGRMIHPLPGTRTGSPFGWRVHPIHGDRRMHAGQDFPAPQGTPIRAADGGRVIYAGRMRGYGNIVILDHGNGIQTRYAHIRDGGIQVRVGQTVSQGQTIAQVGSTGGSTGPHLHFEVRRNAQAGVVSGTPVNPMPYIRP